MRSRLARFLLFGGPLLLWTVVILLSGSDSARYETSWRLLQDALRILCPEHAPKDGAAIQVFVTMYQINGAMRRLAHIGAYAILALLTIRAIQAGNSRLKPEALSAAFGLGVLYTAVDEWHRHFQQVRHAKWDDLFLNLGGVTLTLLGTVLYFTLKEAERKTIANSATEAKERLSNAIENSTASPTGKD